MAVLMVRRNRFPSWVRTTGRVVAVVVVVGLVGGVLFADRQGWLERSYWAGRRGCEPDLAWSTGRPPQPDGATPDVTLTPLLEDINLPTDLVLLDDGRVLVAEQTGAIHRADLEAGTAEEVGRLDVSIDFDQGLLGLERLGDGRHLAANYTAPDGTSRLSTFPLTVDGVPDLDAERVLLEVAQDDVYHNGGALAVTPRGDLLATFGDGGAYADRYDHAQRADTLLGTVIRITPTPEEPEPYTIPADNPFVDDPTKRPEVWLLGTRNPFRVSVDPATGDVWVADVGHDCVEEVTRVPAGTPVANLGWNRYEGTRSFVGGTVEGRLDPLVAYPHDETWCAVIGGQVMEDPRLGPNRGRYLFADYCGGHLVTVDPSGNAVLLEAAVTLPLGFATDDRGRTLVLSVGSIARLDPA